MLQHEADDKFHSMQIQYLYLDQLEIKVLEPEEPAVTVSTCTNNNVLVNINFDKDLKPFYLVQYCIHLQRLKSFILPFN